MKTSQAGLEFIAREEGEVLRTYIDVAGKPTIGVGHLLRPGESYPNGITKEKSRELLAQDVKIAEAQVTSLVTVPMTQNMFDALVSFTFNCGGGALKKSSILRFTNAGDLTAAADAFLLWNKATDPKTGQLVVVKGLTNRRLREKALFLKKDDVKVDVVPEVKPQPTPVVVEHVPEVKDVVPEPEQTVEESVAPPDVIEVLQPPVTPPQPAPIVKERSTILSFTMWKTLFEFIASMLKALFGRK
jgi:lysozyme